MTPDKSLAVMSIDNLDSMSLRDVDAELASYTQNDIACVNWPQVYDYAPLAQFAIARSSRYIYVRFHVVGEDLRAVNTANLSPVAQDSCVEFFLKVAGSDEYWNFEFNCIGTVNASHRVERPNAVRLNDEQIASIKRYASCGTEPFEEKPGMHDWSLTVAIPLALIGAEAAPYIMANFYKCADKTSHPHYLSWAPIPTEKPNFHQPQYFAKLTF